MSVYIKPTNEIVTRLNLEPGGPFHKRFANLCMKHMDRFVPMEVVGKNRGALRRSAHIEADGENVDIVYSTPYAHYMYEGKLWVDPVTGSSWARKDTKKVPTNIDLKYHTNGTGPHWDKRMVSSDMKEIEKILERQMEWVDNHE